MSKSRKLARRQTHRQGLRRKNTLRLNLYHGTSPKNARAIRKGGFTHSSASFMFDRGGNQTLATNRAMAKMYSTTTPRGKRGSIIKVSLTPHGMNKYLSHKSDPQTWLVKHGVPLSTNYGVFTRIPGRYIAKRKRGK